MHLCQFYQNDNIHIGVLEGKKILDVTAMGLRDGMPVFATIDTLIASGDLSAFNKVLKTSPVYVTEESIKFAPVVSNPQKIICAALTHAAHIIKLGQALSDVPSIFSKFNNSLNGHNCEVELLSIAKEYDYEAELVIVLGKRGKFIGEDKASEYIFGYTCGNDLSVRDVQFPPLHKYPQYLLGKTFDGMCPIGPYLVTSDSIDPSNLTVKCKVNGEVRSSGSTSELRFSCAKLVSYISQYITLEQGDIIFAGTCAEGAIIESPPEKRVWLKKGDVVEVEIEGIGILRNKMV